MNYIKLCCIAILVIIFSGCGAEEEEATNDQADFYECPPNNTIAACKPSTVKKGCEFVGSGTTTMKIEDC